MSHNLVERDGYTITVFAMGAGKGRGISICNASGAYAVLHEREWKQFSTDVFRVDLELAGGLDPPSGVSISVRLLRNVSIAFAAISTGLLCFSLPPLDAFLWSVLSGLGALIFFAGFSIGMERAAAEICHIEASRLKDALDATRSRDGRH